MAFHRPLHRVMPRCATLKLVLPIIRHHHERANGAGYPDGLHGDQIPWLTHIFAIP